MLRVGVRALKGSNKLNLHFRNWGHRSPIGERRSEGGGEKKGALNCRGGIWGCAGRTEQSSPLAFKKGKAGAAVFVLEKVGVRESRIEKSGFTVLPNVFITPGLPPIIWGWAMVISLSSGK